MTVSRVTGALSARQVIANIRAALAPGAAGLAAAVTDWLAVPSVVSAINDTRSLGVVPAIKQIHFMTGHLLEAPLVELLRSQVPLPITTTASVSSTRLSISDTDDASVKDLWQQASERARRMHHIWQFAAGSVEDRIESGMHPSENHLRMVALLSDSTGGAARSAATLFEVAASRNEMTATTTSAGRAPMSVDEKGRVVIDMEAIPKEQPVDKDTKLAKWEPHLP